MAPEKSENLRWLSSGQEGEVWHCEGRDGCEKEPGVVLSQGWSVSIFNQFGPCSQDAPSRETTLSKAEILAWSFCACLAPCWSPYQLYTSLPAVPKTSEGKPVKYLFDWSLLLSDFICRLWIVLFPHSSRWQFVPSLNGISYHLQVWDVCSILKCFYRYAINWTLINNWRGSELSSYWSALRCTGMSAVGPIGALQFMKLLLHWFL